MGRQMMVRVNFGTVNLVMVVLLATMTMTSTVVDAKYGYYNRHRRYKSYTPSTSYMPPSSSYTPPSSSYMPPSTSDTPAWSSYMPPSTSDTPAWTSYVPPSTSDTPASTSYMPPSTSDTPAWTSYMPPSTSDTPEWTSYMPPSTSDTPAWTSSMPSTSYTPASTSYDTTSSPWQSAHATFYGDETASETMGGACGYGNLYDSGYGFETAALSSVMFNNGQACGTCYEIKCVESKWCFTNVPSIKITATNLCPPNWYQSSDAGGWCNPPRSHFDLSKPMFMKIAEWTAGIVPVSYRKVPCARTGGIRFQFQGNPYWLLVAVLNVGGSGDVSAMWVKGTETEWISMSRNWGASFQAFSKLGGQSLSFKLQNQAGNIVIAYNVAPTSWSTGQTYQTPNNFN